MRDRRQTTDAATETEGSHAKCASLINATFGYGFLDRRRIEQKQVGLYLNELLQGDMVQLELSAHHFYQTSAQ